MKDVYVEWLVKKERSLSDTLVRVFSIVVAFLGLSLFMLTGSVILLVVGILAIAFTYFAFTYTDVEYEYVYVTGELGIDRILARSRRKRIETLDLSKVEVVAPEKSPKLDGYAHKKYKVLDYSTCDKKNPHRHVFVMYYMDGKKIILEPNRELIEAMRDAAPHKVFMD